MKKIAKRSVEVEVQPEDISPLDFCSPASSISARLCTFYARSMSKRSALLPAARLSFCRQ